MSVFSRSHKALRRACLGATLAAATLAGGTQQAVGDVPVFIPEADYRLAGTISPDVDLDNTYVAAIFNYNSSGATPIVELFKVADSVTAGTTLNYDENVVNDVLVQEAFDFESNTLGYAIVAAYDDGVVVSFDPEDAASIIDFSEDFDALTDGTPTEAELKTALDTMDTTTISSFVEDGSDFFFNRLIGNFDGEASDLVSYSDPTAGGSATGQFVPEPTTAATIALLGGTLILTRRRRGD